MNIAATEIKKGRKYDQVVDGAAHVFMAEGFEGASVDMIARAAGVSKATLYSYFSDKKLLFIEVAQREIFRQADQVTDIPDPAAPPQEVLTRIGTNLTRLILSKFGISVLRVVMAEAERFPEIGRSFYDNGPMKSVAQMARYFEVAEARGEVAIPDKAFAALQFMELCKSGCFMRIMLGIQKSATPQEVAFIVTEAVGMFMARYGTP
jgi:TetR/AcrR family transcriptional repressor of mexJK operon